MSMSMHVQGIRPPDERWQQMRAIWNACDAAGLEIPEEVLEFFGHSEPDAAGVVISLDYADGTGELHECVTEYNADMREGFVIDIDKLPKDVKLVRFMCCY